MALNRSRAALFSLEAEAALEADMIGGHAAVRDGDGGAYFIFTVARRCDPIESEAASRPFLREHAGGRACCGFLRSGKLAAQLNIGPLVVALLPRAISPFYVVMEPGCF
jgi:hypothetical protein